MGLFEGLKFWKKKRPADIGVGVGLPRETPMGLGLGLRQAEAGLPRDEFGLPAGKDIFEEEEPAAGVQGYGAPYGEQPYAAPRRAAERPYVISREREGESELSAHEYNIKQHLEVVNAKLDGIRAGMEAMNQRLANIEREMRQKRW